MNSSPLLQRRRPLGAFTLVEIMIVVVIIGLLAVLAIPAITRVRQASQNSRYISDLRTFAQGFETYALKNGGWPPNAGTGAVPTGMSGEIKDTAWTTLRNSVGGRWNWDRNLNGFAAAISCVGATASDRQMEAVDAKIDDGDLNTGLFQKAGGRFVYVIEQ
jgi:prepilin-type N-terminal cleavage/methylation domain-containing protein